jgi:hypothetical protein
VAWPSLADIRLRVRDGLNEASAGYFDDAEIDRAINAAERHVAAATLCYEHNLSLTTTASQRYLLIPTVTCHKIWRVEYVPLTGDSRPLIKIVPWQVGSQHLTINDVYPWYWFQFGENKVNLEPIPAGAYVMNVFFAMAPTKEMSGDTDVPEVSVEAQEILHLFALYLMLFKKKQYGTALGKYREYRKSCMNIRYKMFLKYGQGSNAMVMPQAVAPAKEQNG